MDNEQGQGRAYGHGFKVDQVTGWFNEALPQDAVIGTVAGLKRIATLDQTTRAQFLDEVKKDPAIARLLEELKTPA
jgi:hypothetical protein